MFSIPIEKKVKKYRKNEEDITKAIFQKLAFTDSARFMASSL